MNVQTIKELRKMLTDEQVARFIVSEAKHQAVPKGWHKMTVKDFVEFCK